MKVPRKRFTVRGMMVAVAIIGTVLGINIARRSAFLKRVDEHVAKSGVMYELFDQNGVGRRVFTDHDERGPMSEARFDYHKTMVDKYNRAARHPWLPVAPDPSEPE